MVCVPTLQLPAQDWIPHQHQKEQKGTQWAHPPFCSTIGYWQIMGERQSLISHVYLYLSLQDYSGKSETLDPKDSPVETLYVTRQTQRCEGEKETCKEENVKGV